jgi:hypothetical protein
MSSGVETVQVDFAGTFGVGQFETSHGRRIRRCYYRRWRRARTPINGRKSLPYDATETDPAFERFAFAVAYRRFVSFESAIRLASILAAVKQLG